MRCPPPLSLTARGTDCAHIHAGTRFFTEKKMRVSTHDTLVPIVKNWFGSRQHCTPSNKHTKAQSAHPPTAVVWTPCQIIDQKRSETIERVSNPKSEFRDKSWSSLHPHLGVPSFVRFSFGSLGSATPGFSGVLPHPVRFSPLTGSLWFILGTFRLAIDNRGGSLSFLPKMSLPTFQVMRAVQASSGLQRANGINRVKNCTHVSGTNYLDIA